MSGGTKQTVAIRVEALTTVYESQAIEWAERLSLPLAGEADWILQLGAQGLQLTVRGLETSATVRVDFATGAVAHRRQFGGGTAQMIAKAVGIQPGVRPTILDATAGLGRDSFVLASLGCSVTMIERQPLIAALLEDGLSRAQNEAVEGPIVARMALLQGNAIDRMLSWADTAPQVVYLDPMFPHREKSSLVKKEMRIFRQLAGDDDDAPALLEAAMKLASHRVVVKRPRKAPAIDGPHPNYALEGKSSRFDIYPRRTFKK